VSTDTKATETATSREVASQPAIWQQTIESMAEFVAPLPDPGTPVLFVGCGTSYYIGEAYSRRRNSLGLGRTRAAVASEIPYLDPAETLVVLSRSGTTTDVIRVIDRLRDTVPVVGIVGEAGTPVAEKCPRLVHLGHADEQSVVQTRFATTALLVLRASLGDDVSGLPAQAERALIDPLPEQDPRHLVFLGTDWTIGVAQEAALKCREAAGAWTEAYPVMEYQHGPISVAGPGSLIWAFCRLPDFVRAAVEATGATVLEPDLDPLAQLVLAHRLALRLAAAAGRDPDHPQFLNRAVELD
jgi:fructoselysine-6-P-deglycase FrlB-like protein